MEMIMTAGMMSFDEELHTRTGLVNRWCHKQNY
jgi:hypothetical protein